MKPITVQTSEKESIIFIEDSLKGLDKLLDVSSTIVIIDENLNRLYPNLLTDYPKIIVDASEEYKTLHTVSTIYEELLRLEADRHTFILGVGGGIVCDITGFVASTYMRGLRFGFVATTLMAQVDAAIGGKNGVNFHRYKNMMGTFCLPEFVWCDVSLLETLPVRERNAGFAEIIKYGLIHDPELLDSIENISNNLDSLDSDIYKLLIKQSVSIKTSIVNSDPFEKGLRKILNFGHTLGHAIEKNSALYNHGEAVSIGMVAALSLSKTIGGSITSKEITRIKTILENFNLPIKAETSLIEKSIYSISADKKRNRQAIDFIILSKIGNATVQSIELFELKSLLLKSI